MIIAVDFDGTLCTDSYPEIGIADAVNANVPEAIERWGNDSRKVSADIYIDDRSEKPWSLRVGEAV